ncbi:MAG: PDZ domain-containing protein [Armatimonadetes bacterium]|nr:PDZ domain-containing protein [Armatimonadota bacterium]
MNLRLRAIFVLSLTLIMAGARLPILAQETTRLLRQPAINQTDIAFVYGGDIWTVSRSGGVARRLTANPSIRRAPKFAPDGKYLAFSGNYDGNNDAYVIPADGGEPFRLTYHPANDMVMGWTPDSQSVLFRSGRAAHTQRIANLFTISVKGGLPKKLPLPEAGLASFSPDGTQIAYNRISREGATWKRYRGGLQAYISVFDLTNNQYSELPHTTTTDFYPMWVDDKIYFASDRTNTVNLFVYSTKNKSVKQLTRYTDYDVKWPSACSNALVFEHGGEINTLDLKTEKITPVNIQIKSDMLNTRPSLRHVEGNIASFALSPAGVRAVFEARGEIFTVPASKGETRNLTNTPGVREQNPVWSPDGKHIAYFSDRAGEMDIYTRSQDGSGEEVRITSDSNVYRTGLAWSPDSKSLLYTDASLHLWMVAIADKKPVLVDKSEVGPVSLGKWSADSKWIAYSKPTPALLNAIYLYSVEKRRIYNLSNGRFNDREPAFDLNGKYLYFISDRSFVPHLPGPEPGINFQNTAQVFALTLQNDTLSPLTPDSDEEKPKEEEKPKPDAPKADAPKPAAPVTPPATPAMKVDIEGLADRIIALPTPPGNYQGLSAGTGSVYFMNNGTLLQFSVASKQVATIMGGIANYDINAAGAKIIYNAPGNLYGIIDPTPNQQPGAGKLNLQLEAKVDPRAEWLQIFNEAWRQERDLYYDPNMRGLDWKAVGERYRKLIPSVAHRDDLSYLLGELIGELNTSHAYVDPGEPPRTPQVSGGLLGVDFEEANGFYRFKKIYRGENWDTARRSPLREPGINVKEGEYLIAVDGKPVTTGVEPYAFFENTADKAVVLKVNSKPSPDGAREVTVRPIANEDTLRYADWVDTNRQKIEKAFGGRVGYIHVPDTAQGGITEFGKAFYALLDKDALIVDERFNSGGFIPDFFVEKLSRKLLSIATPRYGADFKSPPAIIEGPKVMLANEWSGSGGDALPYFFRKAGVGPIIGKRTWGGLVGINGGIPLMDGGGVTAPQFGLWSPQDGKWIAENHGIDPDMEINNTPDKMLDGADPQLERAIAYIREQLKKNAPKKPKHPPFPVEKLENK